MNLEPDETLWLGTVVLTKEQRMQMKEFEDEHWRCYGTKSIRVSSSGIGPNMYLKCTGCGKEIDISPYDRW